MAARRRGRRRGENDDDGDAAVDDESERHKLFLRATADKDSKEGGNPRKRETTCPSRTCKVRQTRATKSA